MKKHIAIIGGGPAALFLAAFLEENKFSITLYEKNKTAGRKFLVAGKGGFNLTHSESLEEFIKRYTPSTFLEPALRSFTNLDLRYYLEKIGIPTFVGSSKRVYPKAGIKPIEVLQAILKTLEKKGVHWKYEHTFSAWDNSKNPIVNGNAIQADYIVFSLGGGSWKVTGSDGSWLDTFDKEGIKTKPFQASNCGYQVDWKPEFIQKHEGKPLKNSHLNCSDVIQKGEAVFTKWGLEGNSIYGLSPQIRAQLNTNSKAQVYIDFKPSFSLAELISKLSTSKAKNTTETLKKELNLSEVQIDLVKLYLSKKEYINPKILAENIKKFPLEITAASSLDEAISTVGGIDLTAVSENFELHQLSNQFCIGEMLDWDAPTGGYLLQGCISSGVHLAKHLNSQE